MPFMNKYNPTIAEINSITPPHVTKTIATGFISSAFMAALREADALSILWLIIITFNFTGSFGPILHSNVSPLYFCRAKSRQDLV